MECSKLKLYGKCQVFVVCVVLNLHYLVKLWLISTFWLFFFQLEKEKNGNAMGRVIFEVGASTQGVLWFPGLVETQFLVAS